MKGVVLAGGTGSRLAPLTLVTNKHLLPIGRYPMIFYPIARLLSAGIKDILVITGAEHAGAIINLLATTSSFDLDFTFRVQKKPDGIAGALRLAETFVGSHKFAVILGDNIFDFPLTDPRYCFEDDTDSRCHLFLRHTETPERFGMATMSESGRVLRVTEKPRQSQPSDLCVTGVYMYTPHVFEVLRTLQPSSRGEYEISDVHSCFAAEQKVSHTVCSSDSVWIDAGTMETYRRANEIAWRTPEL